MFSKSSSTGLRARLRPVELLAFFAVVLPLAFIACGGPPPVSSLGPRPVYLQADKETLIERANAWTAASLYAKGQLRMYWAGNEDERHVDVRLYATRSGAIRLQGNRTLVGQIFTLAADGATFLLRVPSHATTYLGESAAPSAPDPERPYFSLRPHHLTEALLPEPLPRADSADNRVSLQTYPDSYALSWWHMDAAGDISLRRRVTISRLDLRVIRIEAFSAGGRAAFDATYGSYLGPTAEAYPGRIEVHRPWEELVFRFEIEEMRPSPTLPAGVFTLEPIEGYRTMTIEEAMAEIRSQGGGVEPRPDAGPADATSQ
jgi:hypothetical protein